MWVEERRFQAKGESNNIYTVIARRKIVSKSFDGELHKAKAGLDLKLTDSRDVIRHDAESYKIVLTDEIIREIKDG